MQEVVSGIQTVKSFATEEKEKRKMNDSMQSVYKSSLLQNIFLGVSQEIIGFVSNLSSLMVLLISALLIINHQFTIGLYFACLQYANNIFKPVQVFASAGMILQPMVVAINRINEYFEIVGEDNNPNRKKYLNSFKGKIVFHNVSFFYDKGKTILKNISFAINAGEKVIIRGANGTGKTTIIKLLLQLYSPQNGEIYIDDYNAQTIILSNIRKRIGLVSQDIFLFNDTILNNLLYGCDDYSQTKLNSIIEKFCPFIYDLPNGINTFAGESGNNLSGGQKQAISIVRAILKRPDILLFDEGNTNLDNQSRNNLMDLVNEYFVDKTCIFITHGDYVFKGPIKIFSIENNSIV
jgi:ABC-type multidrug transport system fused ATPase/permease subunit